MQASSREGQLIVPPLAAALAKKLEFLLELANDAVLVLDAKGFIIIANDVAERIFNCPAKELEGATFRSLRTADSITPLPYNTRPDNLIYQAWFSRKGGGSFLGDVSLSTITEEGEKYYICLLRDVSVREESRRQQQLSSAVFENSLQGIVITDENNRVLAANPAFVRLTGYELSELVGRTPNILKSGLHDREFYTKMWDAITRSGQWQGEILDRRKDGGIIPLWFTISVVRDPAGKIVHHIAICSDVSERKQAEKKLRRLNDLYSALSEVNQLIARRLDQDSLFQETCRVAVDYGRLKLAWIALLDPTSGYIAPVAAYGEHKRQLEPLRVPIDPAQPGGRALVGEAVRTGRLVVSNDYLGDPGYDWSDFVQALGSRAGAAFPIARNNVPIGALMVLSEERDFFDEDLTLLLGRMTDDISFALDTLDQEERRQQAEARIAYLARHDTLTGLYRRNALEEALAGELAKAMRNRRTLSIGLIDLDHFKIINDSYGHQVGDQVLVGLSGVLTQMLRKTDWVGRWGGEEFLCILPDTDSEAAAELLDRVCSAISRTSFQADNRSLAL
ncbi:MAG: sensor domain-containing diguanylate cyclase [Acidobacteriaceae bacterium]